MKKTYQIEREITVMGGETKTINLQLKENYQKCIGFFLTPDKDGTDFSKLTVGLNIAQQEILPRSADAALFALTNYIGRADATYDFSEENIPARSSDVQLIFENRETKGYQRFNVYFILSNE